MRTPIQSLRLAFGASAMLTVGCLIAFTAAAQETSSAAAPPTGVTPSSTETRPPDCLDCGSALPPIPRNITNVSWLNHPLPEYPVQAMRGGIAEGRASLECTATTAGQLVDCRVVSELPMDAGFGASALAAAARARVTPQTVDGTPTASKMTFTVRFRAPSIQPPSSPTTR